MQKSTKIILGVVAVLILYVMFSYNGLVSANFAIDGQWAQVEAQYQRRFDLIPNLVESVKGIMKQETAVFTAIADARTRYAGATTVDARAKAAGEVESALGRLLVITENYPQLKSSENVQTLMAEVAGTENRVSVERKRFNDAVQSYTLRTKRFPSNIIASVFGFGAREYFEAAAGTENAPKVQF
ncbi:MAG: LemA family protein [Patescibacteria group bacterium]